MEILDVVDDSGKPTGETIERGEAHREGVQHRTAHVWIARNKNGRIQLLLQKRCMQKDSFPGCYDISSAGHIPAGVDYVASALRELKEELGVKAKAEDLIDCGLLKKQVDTEFHQTPYHDYQISRVFLLWLDWEEDAFTLQEEEIDSVRWMDYAQCRGMVAADTLPNCIIMEELDMLAEHFRKRAATASGRKELS